MQLCMYAVHKEDITNFTFTVKTFNEYLYFCYTGGFVIPAMNMYILFAWVKIDNVT
jgi:hypothetical protein